MNKNRARTDKWIKLTGVSLALSFVVSAFTSGQIVYSKVVKRTTTTTTVEKTSHPAQVVLKELPDTKELSQFLMRRKSSVTDMINSRNLAEREKPAFRTQLSSIESKINTSSDQGELYTEKAFEIADDLDDLIVRIGAESGKEIVPNRIVVDTINRGTINVSDSRKEPVEVMALRPEELELLLTEREKKVADFIDTTNATGIDMEKFTSELDRIHKLRNHVKQSKGLYIPIAVKYDTLGKEVLGVVQSYEFLPVVGIYISSHFHAV